MLTYERLGGLDCPGCQSLLLSGFLFNDLVFSLLRLDFALFLLVIVALFFFFFVLSCIRSFTL